MASMVCQGLQSCLESQLSEPRKFRRKLSLKSRFLDPNTTKAVEEQCPLEETGNKTSNCSSEKGLFSNPDMGGWSFLQALSTCPKEQEKPYVHPMMKRSSSMLSAKSLELCTENLGNETGSDMLEDSIFSLSSSDYAQAETVPPVREEAEAESRQPDKKPTVSRKFPPPLTTISGSESLRVRSHREDGRLVMEAVKAPSPRSLFQAERSNGRLRLLLLKACFDYEETPADMENEENKNEEEFENGGNLEFEEEEYELLSEDGQDSGSDWEEEDIQGNRVDVGGKLGMEKFPRAGRCKEGEHELRHENKGLLNWEPFWVATS